MMEVKKGIKINGSFGFKVGNDAARMSLKASKQRPSSPGRVSGSCLATYILQMSQIKGALRYPFHDHT